MLPGRWQLNIDRVAENMGSRVQFLPVGRYRSSKW